MGTQTDQIIQITDYLCLKDNISGNSMIQTL